MTPFQTRYYNFWTKIFKFEGKMNLYDIDFEKKWWLVIWRQKNIFLSLLLILGLLSFYDSILPVWLSQSIENQNPILITWTILGRVILTIIYLFISNFNPLLQLRTINSVFYSANKKLIEIDPIYHSTKSSGVIISKINKGSRSFEVLLDVITFELFGIGVGLISSVGILISFNLKIGFIASLSMTLMAIISIYISRLNNETFKPISIEAEDKVSQTSIETMQQAAYIRSVFSTKEQLSGLSGNIKKFAGIEGTQWRSSGIAHLLIRILFYISSLIIALMVLNEIESKNITALVGVGLITSYMASSNNIRNLGEIIKRLTESHSRITDLFEFMRTFGKQTYPVLEEKQIVNKN